MSWFAAVSGKRGRSPKFSDAAIQFCLTLKNLFGLALRQTTGLVQSVLQLSGLAWPVPDFSTPCRRQLELNVQVPYTRSQAGLHIGIDAQTLQIRAICLTSNNVSDASFLPDLLQQLPEDEALESLTGDGAYDTQPVHEAVMRRGSTPAIPARKNARLRKGCVFEYRNAAIAACWRLGRGIWKRWSGYHQRSLVETKMNCIKRLGERVMVIPP